MFYSGHLSEALQRNGPFDSPPPEEWAHHDKIGGQNDVRSEGVWDQKWKIYHEWEKPPHQAACPYSDRILPVGQCDICTRKNRRTPGIF